MVLAIDVTRADFNSLADKLDSLELTEAEDAILGAVVEEARSLGETSGFALTDRPRLVQAGATVPDLTERATHFFDIWIG